MSTPSTEFRPDFPEGYTDTELKDHIKGSLKSIEANDFGMNAIVKLTPIIQLAQGEINERSSKRNQNASWYLSLAAIVLGLISTICAGIGTWFSIRSNRQSTEWQQEEIQRLEEIRDSIKAPKPSVSP